MAWENATQWGIACMFSFLCLHASLIHSNMYLFLSNVVPRSFAHDMTEATLVYRTRVRKDMNILLFLRSDGR